MAAVTVKVNPEHVDALALIAQHDGATAMDLARPIATVIAHDATATLIDPTAVRRLLRTGLLDAITINGNLIDVQITNLGRAALNHFRSASASTTRTGRPALYAVA